MLKFSKLGGDRNAKWERKSWEGIVWQWWLTMLKSRWGQTQMRKEILRGHCLTMMIGERTPWKGIVWQWWLEKEHPERALFDNDGWRKNILKGHCLTMIIDNAQIKSRWGQKCKMRKNILKDHCLTMMIGERTPWKGIVWQWRLEKEHPERALFDNDDWQCSKVGGDRNAHMLRSTQIIYNPTYIDQRTDISIISLPTNRSPFTVQPHGPKARNVCVKASTSLGV